MFTALLIPVLALSAGLFFLLPRKESRPSGGRFLDDIIPALDSFLEDFPQLFPKGSYAVTPGAYPPEGEKLGEGSVAFSREEDGRWLAVAGREEIRTYFFRDDSALSTMVGFTLGVTDELGAAAGLKFFCRKNGRLTTMTADKVSAIAENFKREYGLL